MKYIAQLLTVVFLATSLAASAEAQILKRLKKKAQQAVEKKVEQKIDEELQKTADQMVEDSWDAVFGEMPESEGGNGINMPFAFNSDVTTQDSYSFDIVTTMEISATNTSGSSEEPMYMDMHFKEGASYTGTKIRGGQMQQNGQDLFIIYDFSNEAMIMLMDSKEGKFSFAYDWTQGIDLQPQTTDESNEQDVNWDETDEWQGYEKIGTKTIAGYNSDGYRMQNDHNTTEVWVTRENTFGMASLFKANTNTKQMKGVIPAQYPQGMLMEMTSTDHETGEKTSMKVTKIVENADVSYTMADYPKMSPSNMKN